MQTALYDQQEETTVEFVQVRTQSANDKVETTGMEFVAIESERLARCAKAGRALESNVRTPSTYLYSALPTGHAEFKNLCKKLKLEQCCILGLAEEAKKFAPWARIWKMRKIL